MPGSAIFRVRLIRALLATSSCFAICSCGRPPEKVGITEEVPDVDWALCDGRGHPLPDSTPSYERGSAPILEYKGRRFNLKEASEAMAASIEKLAINSFIGSTGFERQNKLLLKDGRVLVSGGRRTDNPDDITNAVYLVDPFRHSITALASMCIPRVDHSSVQITNGRIVFIGGETSAKFSDRDTKYTSNVEELDLLTNQSKVIGNLFDARAETIVEPIARDKILVVGGWRQRPIAKDEKWSGIAEILTVP